MIPKKIHYVWVGGPLPDRLRRYLDSWHATNPDYEVVRWNEDNIDLSMPVLRSAYRRRRWSKIADIVRLQAIYEHGGIYLDTDILLRGSLDPLLEHTCFFAFQHESHPTDMVANCVFGAERHHWFIKEALNHVLALPPVPFGLERPTRTGPKLVTRLLRQRGLKQYDSTGVYVRDIFVCPKQMFFPFSWRETYAEAAVGPETLGIHFWESSWESSLPFYLRMAKTFRKRLAGAYAQ
ncbi:conserved protein of unknown function [Rhodovastum atsumiense]|uniref:Glycosyl transferase n=1 Tax=Rhodovastum atsumiense TaxID=504468 RepID=A0A5M6J3E5_9PROT|nr:glycosyltransferase [Rhodovastum atsumiense]KAA5614637.1 hypothetical protein F1189_00465 [Rhodovastum atsumiense]CAH2599848.1 conserved protein of unknown function [Rhodovastum atsumiense]